MGFRVKSVCIFYYFKIMCYILYIKRNVLYFYVCTNFPSGSAVKNLPARQVMQETQVWSLGGEDLLEKGMATHSSVLAWRIPWTEEPGGLQFMGPQRVGHDWAQATTSQHISLSCIWNVQRIWKQSHTKASHSYSRATFRPALYILGFGLHTGVYF